MSPKIQSIAAILLAASMECSATALAQQDKREAALQFEQQGRTAEAEVAWQAWTATHPTDAEAFAHLGLLESRDQNYPAAIQHYRKAMTLAPGMQGLRPNLGLAYFKNGDYRQAIETFAPLLKANPNDDRLVVLTGMAHYGLGDYGAATPWLKKAADHDPQNLALLSTLAHSCLFAHQYPCVLDTFHKIIALNPNSAEAHVLMGEAFDEMKDPVGAQREFRAAIAANPKEPNVHFGLGYLLWTKGQFAEAAQEFQAELSNDPQHLQAMLYLADAYIQTDKLDEAQPLLEKLAAQTPDSAMVHRDLAVFHAARNENDEAVKEFQGAIRLAPGDVNAHYRLARLYRTMGRTAEANAEFEKSRSLNKAADEHLLKVMSKIPGSSASPPGPTKK